MLKEVNWSLDKSYRTGSNREPVQFYLDGLCNSNKFDLLLGYFSSAAINVLSIGFASFLYHGGILRMIVNNVLSKEDKDAIKAGKAGTIQNELIDLTNITELKNTLDEYGKHFFNCISWLISNNRIQIKIIRPKSGNGISHYKSGVFSDGNDSVSFKASCNFTAFGLLENLEELDCNLSWVEGNSKVESQTSYFETIFSGRADFVEYLGVEDIQIAIKNEFGDKTLNELMIQEKELIEKKNLFHENKKNKRIFDDIISKIEELESKPKFPFKEGLRAYQMEAYTN